MSTDRPTMLLGLAREIAGASGNFQAVLGPGEGDKATNAFMQQLRKRAKEAFGKDHSEQKICGDTSLPVGFYFPTRRLLLKWRSKTKTGVKS